jgi:hypothetical protein
MRDILHDYHKRYIGRALHDTHPNPYKDCTDIAILTTQKKWKITEHLIECEWAMFELAPEDEPDGPASSYGTPSHPPKRLMEAILDLVEEHHAQQLSALQKAFDILAFLELPYPYLQTEPPMEGSRRVNTTEG